VYIQAPIDPKIYNKVAPKNVDKTTTALQIKGAIDHWPFIDAAALGLLPPVLEAVELPELPV